MAKKNNAKKKKHAGPGVMTVMLLVVLAAALGWKLFDLRDQLKSARAEKDFYTLQVENVEEENEQLKKDIEEGTTPEKVEEIARNELGLVTPGEYVFYDTSN